MSTTPNGQKDQTRKRLSSRGKSCIIALPHVTAHARKDSHTVRPVAQTLESWHEEGFLCLDGSYGPSALSASTSSGQQTLLALPGLHDPIDGSIIVRLPTRHIVATNPHAQIASVDDVSGPASGAIYPADERLAPVPVVDVTEENASAVMVSSLEQTSEQAPRLNHEASEFRPSEPAPIRFPGNEVETSTGSTPLNPRASNFLPKRASYSSLEHQTPATAGDNVVAPRNSNMVPSATNVRLDSPLIETDDNNMRSITAEACDSDSEVAASQDDEVSEMEHKNNTIDFAGISSSPPSSNPSQSVFNSTSQKLQTMSPETLDSNLRATIEPIRNPVNGQIPSVAKRLSTSSSLNVSASTVDPLGTELVDGISNHRTSRTNAQALADQNAVSFAIKTTDSNARRSTGLQGSTKTSTSRLDMPSHRPTDARVDDTHSRRRALSDTVYLRARRHHSVSKYRTDQASMAPSDWFRSIQEPLPIPSTEIDRENEFEVIRRMETSLGAIPKGHDSELVRPSAHDIDSGSRGSDNPSARVVARPPHWQRHQCNQTDFNLLGHDTTTQTESAGFDERSRDNILEKSLLSAHDLHCESISQERSQDDDDTHDVAEAARQRQMFKERLSRLESQVTEMEKALRTCQNESKQQDEKLIRRIRELQVEQEQNTLRISESLNNFRLSERLHQLDQNSKDTAEGISENSMENHLKGFESANKNKRPNVDTKSETPSIADPLICATPEKSNAKANIKVAMYDSPALHGFVLRGSQPLEVSLSAAQSNIASSPVKPCISSEEGPEPQRDLTFCHLADSHIPTSPILDAYTETIAVLQEQLQQREASIERQESDIAAVLSTYDNHMDWLQELLDLRLTELRDLVSLTEKDPPNIGAMKSLAVRLHANLELGLRVRQSEGDKPDESNLPSFKLPDIIRSFAASPRGGTTTDKRSFKLQEKPYVPTKPLRIPGHYENPGGHTQVQDLNNRKIARIDQAKVSSASMSSSTEGGSHAKYLDELGSIVRSQPDLEKAMESLYQPNGYDSDAVEVS